MSDVFGSLVKQYAARQDAGSADWLIGDSIFTPAFAGDALRSLKAPGEAYNSDVFGKDPQPRHMDHYQDLPDTRAGDNGGVHINSGIPNHAFYLAATAIGGHAWETAGHIWYETLTKNCGPKAQFQDFANSTVAIAGRLYGATSVELQAVREAWRRVGIVTIGTTVVAPPMVTASGETYREEASLDALHQRIAALTSAVERLQKVTLTK